MRREVSYLPELPHQMNMDNKRVGSNVHKIIDLCETVTGTHAVLMISLPTCRPCHDSLSEFLQQNKRLQIPFACLTMADEGEYYQMFCHDYGAQVEILPINETQLKRMGVNRFPTFLIIDNNGIILREFILVEYLIRYIEQMPISMQIGKKDEK
ncbi:hypothetical protein [uncultured Brevibacillus sp.]|uniref:TlpA family protein disulfide reductase n=1 Tax=uncultured Brevibacillus sp. TaxID=169970 RepID=UPI002598C9F8|nr:hypothetical protein [uncultured Brevibacillus sp.]